MLNELCMDLKGRDICEDAKAEFNSALSMVRVAKEKVERDQAGFMVSQGRAGPLKSIEAMQRALWNPEALLKMRERISMTSWCLYFLRKWS